MRALLLAVALLCSMTSSAFASRTAKVTRYEVGKVRLSRLRGAPERDQVIRLSVQGEPGAMVRLGRDLRNLVVGKHGTVKGEARGGTLRLKIKSGGLTERLDYDAIEYPRVASDVEAMLREHGLDLPRDARVKLFD